MNLSRVAILLFAVSPFAFGASKEIQELQRDVAMLQDQVRTLQSSIDQKVAAIQTLTQQTLDSVNRTNTAVAVMENRFNDAMKQQEQSLNGPVANVGQKLDQMSEDFRAVRESVLDMNTRLGKLDAKVVDLQNLINTIRTPPAAPPPQAGGTVPATGDTTNSLAPSGPPAGLQADTLYTNAFRDYQAGKYDISSPEFSQYLMYFGGTAFAPSAQYYLADISYRKQDYTTALEGFDAVLEKYPDNVKTADAHYMKGLCEMNLGRNDAAARDFRDVYTHYAELNPDIAAKAKARLREMGLSVTAKKRRTAAR
ncbi:MAG TPA: tetratricopeptide repeat protein [Bryobacteraceae bacterium]|nr:tetratricopeptide repeat protein [Bryobacteraceae bacterium]